MQHSLISVQAIIT